MVDGATYPARQAAWGFSCVGALGRLPDSGHHAAMMLFDWCDAKCEEVLAERGFDFNFASRIWQGSTLEAVDERKDYGETRIKAIGRIDGRCYAVVYTMREGVHWIITAWPASRQERRKWLWQYDPQSMPGRRAGQTPPKSKPPRNRKSKGG